MGEDKLCTRENSTTTASSASFVAVQLYQILWAAGAVTLDCGPMPQKFCQQSYLGTPSRDFAKARARSRHFFVQ